MLYTRAYEIFTKATLVFSGDKDRLGTDPSWRTFSLFSLFLFFLFHIERRWLFSRFSVRPGKFAEEASDLNSEGFLGKIFPLLNFGYDTSFGSHLF